MNAIGAWRAAMTAAAVIGLMSGACAADLVHPFKIGSLQAMALKDGELTAPNDGKTLGVDHSTAEISALLAAAGAPTDHFNLSIQPLLVQAGPRTLLFDTGFGNFMGDVGGKLPAALSAAKIDPATVTDIFISHAHGDHVGGLITPGGNLAFVNAAIHISKAEWAALSALTPEEAAQVGLAQYSTLMAAIKPKVVTFEPGSDLIPATVKAVDLKGHTPGHSGYRITSGKSSILYIGDAMHHYVVSVQRPRWRIQFDKDPATAEATREMIDEQSAGNGQLIYAVHFPFPGIGHIVKAGDGFRWQAQEIR